MLFRSRSWRSGPTPAEAAPALLVPLVGHHSGGPHRPVLGPVSRVTQADASSRHLASVGLLCPQTEGVKQGWGFSETQRAGLMKCRGVCSERLGVPAACQGGSERPCSGNGHCTGDGSRQGDGSCQCHPGYRGPLCADCMDGYFNSLRNETHSICSGTRSCLCGREGDPVTADPGFWELRAKARALVRCKKGHDRTSSRDGQIGRASCRERVSSPV